VLALCFGQKERPGTYEDFLVRIIRALAGGEDVHIFGLADVFWATWTSHNSIFFDKKDFRNPCDIIFSICVFMQYWSSLY
jgi:hypothetical protein